jgi:predicted HTH domain antitoxin
MSVILHIPDSIVSGLRLPEPEIEPRLTLELALALYSQGILSFGKASELAAVSRFQFAEFLGGRGIPRQYGAEELAEDLTYARGE